MKRHCGCAGSTMAQPIRLRDVSSFVLMQVWWMGSCWKAYDSYEWVEVFVTRCFQCGRHMGFLNYISHQLSVHYFLDSRCKTVCCDSPRQERDPKTHGRWLAKHPKGRETRATVSWPVAVTTVNYFWSQHFYPINLFPWMSFLWGICIVVACCLFCLLSIWKCQEVTHRCNICYSEGRYQNRTA